MEKIVVDLLGIKPPWLVMRINDRMHINYVLRTQYIVVVICFIVVMATMFRIKPIQCE